MGKEAWPKGQALISPRGMVVAISKQWNNGMVERWNIGYEKLMMS